MAYLIDGYNLLHAMGVLRGRAGPKGLQKARLGLLGLLSATYAEDAPSVTVVFDAAGAPPGVPQTQEYQGIHVRFAVHQDQADDLIEDLIGHESAPRQLAVVSDDHRLKQAARRRRCQVLGCEEYLAWLEYRRHQSRKSPPDPESKPSEDSADEREHWLQVFADLQNDPRLRVLSDPVEWKDLDG